MSGSAKPQDKLAGLGPLMTAFDSWQASRARLDAAGANPSRGLQAVVRYKYEEILREARSYGDMRVAREVPTAVPYAWVGEGVLVALNGYLRRSSSGGMPESDVALVRACVEQMLELGYLESTFGERVLRARGISVPEPVVHGPLHLKEEQHD